MSLGNLVARDQYRARARTILERLRRDGLGFVTTECVGWGDCASFAVMEELALERVFGFDDDFARAGFPLYR